MIWPVIDPINASTKSSSKLTAATQLVKYILVVGDRKGPLIQRLSMRGIFIGSRIVSFPRIIPIRKKQSLSLSKYSSSTFLVNEIMLSSNDVEHSCEDEK